MNENVFFKFVYDRQMVWYNRFCKNINCWTLDQILKTYKFCNVYRELDKGTNYLIQKLKGTTKREFIFINVVFYRFFNKYNLYEELNIPIIEKWNFLLTKKLFNRFNKLKKKGISIFNNAYLISGNKTNEPKHVFILKQLENNLCKENLKKIQKKIDLSKTPQESLEAIKTIPLVGNFLAYEIWTDLTYFSFFKQKWTDNDFVNVGPGAKWGLEIIYGKLSNREFLDKIYFLYEKQKKYLDNINTNLRWKDICYKDCFTNYPYLSLRNIEHSLCEFRKYIRLKEKKGKKRYYHKEGQHR
jgi:hypothetical protein